MIVLQPPHQNAREEQEKRGKANAGGGASNDALVFHGVLEYHKATMLRATTFLLSLTAALPLFAQTPVISDSGIVNAVTRDSTQPIAPGSIVSIFGSQLASATANADSVPLSTSIAGVSVTFNGFQAAVRLVSPTLISVQVPWETLGADSSGTA